MDEQMNSKRQVANEAGMMGADAALPYDMSVAGEEDTTLWDNLVQALKPDLTPNRNKQQS